MNVIDKGFMDSRCELTEDEEARRGKIIGNALNVTPDRKYPGRWYTDWGTKTDLGLFRMIRRIVEEGE